jgi:hypothetical protein
MPITATPSTYGAKNVARKKLRPRNSRFSIKAMRSGITTSSGTEYSVNLPVASMLFQKGPKVVDPGVTRST